MKQLLRRGIDRMPAPIPLYVQDAFRFVRYPKVRRRRQMHRQILDRLERPSEVVQGPFRGMRYISVAYCSEVLPKLLGTYECELDPAIEAICRAGCDRIVDIGAAEGYYAVGMALRNPEATIIGFEMNPTARFYLRRLSRCNGVEDRIQIEGTCDTESLREALEDARLPAVICDCEGAEDGLLRPDRVESLRRALILVETHDGMETGDGVLEGVSRRTPGTLRGLAPRRGDRQSQPDPGRPPARVRPPLGRGGRGDERGASPGPVALHDAEARPGRLMTSD